jgi:hypothetical protein
MSFDPKVIEALAELRRYAAKYPTMGLSGRINALDNAGVFAALDEQTGYASAVEILAESAQDDVTKARHALSGGVSGLGKLERVPGTDTLRPAPETDEWTARARAIEGLRPKGRPAPCSCGGIGSGCTCD